MHSAWQHLRTLPESVVAESDSCFYSSDWPDHHYAGNALERLAVQASSAGNDEVGVLQLRSKSSRSSTSSMGEGRGKRPSRAMVITTRLPSSEAFASERPLGVL